MEARAVVEEEVKAAAVAGIEKAVVGVVASREVAVVRVAGVVAAAVEALVVVVGQVAAGVEVKVPVVEGAVGSPVEAAPEGAAVVEAAEVQVVAGAVGSRVEAAPEGAAVVARVEVVKAAEAAVPPGAVAIDRTNTAGGRPWRPPVPATNSPVVLSSGKLAT